MRNFSALLDVEEAVKRTVFVNWHAGRGETSLRGVTAPKEKVDSETEGAIMN